MTSPHLDDRIDTPIDTKTKEKYCRHAEKRYGLKLAQWVRMLMQRDYRSER